MKSDQPDRTTSSSAAPSGLWRRDDGSVMVPMNLHRASLRERLYVIRLGWRACHNVRLTLLTDLSRWPQVLADYEQWEVHNV